jgi:hypothetical protein
MIPEIRGLDTETGDPKYARTEFERRWLVDTAPARRSRRVLDADRGPLHRRHAAAPAADEPARPRRDQVEADQEIRMRDRPARPIVSAYLTEAEYALLAALPAAR